MEKENISSFKNDSNEMKAKLMKTKDICTWLVKEMDTMFALNHKSEYTKVVNKFELVSDGIQQVKDSLDPMYDHYEVVPTKLVTNDKVNELMMLIHPRRHENLIKHEEAVMSQQFPKLFKKTQKELEEDQSVLYDTYK